MSGKFKPLILISLCLAGIMILAACKMSGSVTADATDGTIITAESSVTAATKEPTETAAVTTPIPTPVTMEEVVMLPVPATYTSLFDGTKIYSDGSRTVILKTLVKGDRVTITGTSGKYGVTAEGSFVNLHLMSIVITVTPAPAETTAAPTDPTAATTKAPATTTKATTAAATKTPVATTKATTAATTVAPPVETTVSSWTELAYAENCDNIKSLIIAQLQAKGLWFPDAEVNGGGSVQLSVGFANADDQYATAFVNGKFGQSTSIGATSVSVWIADGYLNMSYTKCYLPAA